MMCYTEKNELSDLSREDYLSWRDKLVEGGEDPDYMLWRLVMLLSRQLEGACEKVTSQD